MQRAAAADDVFLIRSPLGLGLERTVHGLVAVAALRGERILIAGLPSTSLDRLLARLEGDPAIWAVRLCGAADSRPPQDDQVRRLLPQQRCETLARALARAASERVAQAQQQVASWRSLLEAVPTWRQACANWAAEAAALAELRLQVRCDATALKQEIQADRVDRRASWWQQHQAECARHEASCRELDERIAHAAAELAHAQEQLARWRTELEKQEALVVGRRFPNPLSLRWWRALFQGRLTRRLEEFRARCQEAEINQLAARSHHQIELENQDIEMQRHAAALQQIFSAEAARRNADLVQAVANRQLSLDETHQRWRHWLEPLADTSSSASMPIPESLQALEQAWTAALRQAEEELAAARQAEADLPRRLQEVPAACRALANVVAVALDAPVPLTEAEEAWLLPGFDRLIVLNADHGSREGLAALASWAKAAILIATPPALNTNRTEAFDDLWNRLRPPSAPRAMRWLRDQGLWHCVWAGLTSELQPYLQHEALADRPEVNLFIAAPPDQPSRLAIIEFPEDRFSLESAKHLHVSELGEWALDPIGSEWRLEEEAGRLVLDFLGHGGTDSDRAWVTYPGGIAEQVCAVPDAASQGRASSAWRTVRLTFAIDAGWTWDRVRAWLAQHWHIHDHHRTFELMAADRPPELLNLLVALLPEAESCFESRPAAPGHYPLSHLLWARRTEPSSAPRPRSSVLKRLEGGPMIAFTEKTHPTFNVHETSALLETVAQLLQELHAGGACPSGMSALRILFLACTDAQRQLLIRGWKHFESLSSLAVEFGLLQALQQRDADIVALSLWPQTLGCPDAASVLDSCRNLMLAARRFLVIAGDLAHLMPTQLIEEHEKETPRQLDARQRLRRFHALLRDAAEATSMRQAAHRTVA